MINTLGGCVGFVIGSRVKALLPSRQRIDDVSRKRSEKVSYTRRIMAAFVDFFLLTFVLFLLGNTLPLPDEVIMSLAFFGYFMGIPLLWHGRTPGKALVRIRVAAISGGFPYWAHLLFKYGLLYLLYCFLRIPTMGSSLSPLVTLSIFLAVLLLLFVDWVRSFQHGKRLWYERWSGTENQSTVLVAEMQKETAT